MKGHTTSVRLATLQPRRYKSSCECGWDTMTATQSEALAAASWHTDLIKNPPLA